MDIKESESEATWQKVRMKLEVNVKNWQAEAKQQREGGEEQPDANLDLRESERRTTRQKVK